MSAFEVLEVAVSPHAREELLDVSIVRPTGGETGETLALPLEGWVVGAERQPERIDVLCDGRLVRTALLHRPLARARPELRDRHPELPGDLQCGFVTRVGVLGLPPEFELELRAVLTGSNVVTIAMVKARHEPLRAPFEATVQPLLVTAPPRSGTTWLMKVLSGHAEVVLEDVHPYESWPAKYWTHALKVLTYPADPVNSTRALGLDADPFRIGHNPFFTARAIRKPEQEQWLGRTHVERTAAFVMETIEDWYVTLARSQGRGRPRFFAEKQMTRHGISPVLMWELYPRAKEVFLVRDFRDLACSHLSFGTDPDTGEPVGKLAGKSSEEYVRADVRAMAVDFRDAWRSRRERAHLMRYEELVQRPHETVGELLAYLELDRDPDTVQAMLETEVDAAGHITSPDPNRSIGRWRNEDEAFQALCEETFRDLLDEFGYRDT